jgi:dTDP-4-dehydrorhamnose reductase
MRILILGISGMLGNAMFRYFSKDSDLSIFGTSRADSVRNYFGENLRSNIVNHVDVESFDSLIKLFGFVKPNVVINCIGLIKQGSAVIDPLQVIPINSILPHRLAGLCEVSGSRLIHVSTDCVFSGEKGGYIEDDFPDATDLYGRSKLLGEVNYPHAITLRTSIIGHELNSSRSLLNWFLSQTGQVKGYVNARFSGLPTIELARVVRDYVLPNQGLNGVYHVAAQPISKFDLLNLIAAVYEKQIEIAPDGKLVIDRSLNADRFLEATGYVAPEWPALIKTMHSYN